MRTLRKAIAFVRRDLIVESSYKFAFVFELLTSVFPVLSFFFIARLVGGDRSAALARYGGEYFPFAMVGVAFTQYLMVALNAFSGTIKRSQMAGCLEAMLSSRTAPQTVILLSVLYGFVVKTVHIGLIFAVAGLFLGVSYAGANLFAGLVVLMGTVAAFSALGILSAALIVVLKKGDPIEWMFGSLSSLLGGALFPIEVMPGWMQAVAKVLPITYALDAMRLAMFRGYSIPMLWRELGMLGVMAALLLPLSVWVFGKAVEKGRRDGSLMQY